MGRHGTLVFLGLLLVVSPTFAEEAATAETPTEPAESPKDEAKDKKDAAKEEAKAPTPESVTEDVAKLFENPNATTEDFTKASEALTKEIDKLIEQAKAAPTDEKKEELLGKARKLTELKDQIANKRMAKTGESIKAIQDKANAEKAAKAKEEAEAIAKAESEEDEAGSNDNVNSTHAEPRDLTTFQNYSATPGGTSSYVFDNGPPERSNSSQSFPRTPPPSGSSFVPKRVASTTGGSSSSSSSSSSNSNGAGSSVAIDSSAPAQESNTSSGPSGFGLPQIAASAGVSTVGATSAAGGIGAYLGRMPASLPMPELKLEGTEPAKIAQAEIGKEQETIRRQDPANPPANGGSLLSRLGGVLVASNDSPKDIKELEGRGFRMNPVGSTRGIYASTSNSAPNSDTAKSGPGFSPESVEEKIVSNNSNPKKNDFFGIKSTTAQIRGQGEYIQLGVRDESPTTDTISLTPKKLEKPAVPMQLAQTKFNFKAIPTYNSPSGIKDPVQVHRAFVASEPVKNSKKKDFRSFRENPFL